MCRLWIQYLVVGPQRFSRQILIPSWLLVAQLLCSWWITLTHTGSAYLLGESQDVSLGDFLVSVYRRKSRYCLAFLITELLQDKSSITVKPKNLLLGTHATASSFMWSRDRAYPSDLSKSALSMLGFLMLRKYFKKVEYLTSKNKATAPEIITGVLMVKQ